MVTAMDRKAQRHVDRFLIRLSPRVALVRLLEEQLDLLQSSDDWRQLILDALSWLEITGAVVLGHNAVLRHINPLENQSVLTVAALLYLDLSAAVSKKANFRPISRQKLGSATKARKQLDKALRAIEPEFVKRLLFEAQIHSVKDSKFADALEQAKRDVSWVLLQVSAHVTERTIAAIAVHPIPTPSLKAAMQDQGGGAFGVLLVLGLVSIALMVVFGVDKKEEDDEDEAE